jgi:hypothetical protein
MLWVGFALGARLVWLAPVIALLLGAEYHAIVRWEEHVLESRLGDAYRGYVARVPRWLPSIHNWARRDLSDRNDPTDGGISWRETIFSERGTLIAIAVGYMLLWIKAQTLP